MNGDTRSLETLNGKMPMWAKLVLWLGFPIVVAMYFMAINIGWFDVSAEEKRLNLEHRDDTKEMVRLLRVICRTGGGDLTQCGPQH